MVLLVALEQYIFVEDLLSLHCCGAISFVFQNLNNGHTFRYRRKIMSTNEPTSLTQKGSSSRSLTAMVAQHPRRAVSYSIPRFLSGEMEIHPRRI